MATPITRGTTPDFAIIFSKDEIASLDLVSKFYITFKQKGTVISALNKTYEPTDDECTEDDKYIYVKFTLTQTNTLALTADIDLEVSCIITYVETIDSENRRKEVKNMRIGVCDTDKGSVLT